MREMRNDKRQTAGTIAALAGGAYWGFSGCCGQYLFGQKGIEALWLMAMGLFFTGTVLILAGFKLHGRDNLRVFRKKRDAIRLLTFVIFGTTLCQFAYFVAIQASNAGTAIVLQYLSPILILAVACMRELHPPKGLELVVIGLFLFDIFIVGTHGDIHSFHITGEALFWGLLATVNPVIYIIISGGSVFRYDIYQVLGFGMFFGGIVMGAIVQSWSYGVVWDAGITGALAGAVVAGTVIALGLYLQDVSMIGPLKRSVMESVEPVFVVVISVFRLGTWFTLSDSLGLALMLGAAFVFTFAHRPGGETAKGADFSADS